MLLIRLTPALIAATLFEGTAGHPVQEVRVHEHREVQEEPCKLLRDTVETWFKKNNIVPNDSTGLPPGLAPRVPAAPVKPSLAFACLASVPLNKNASLGQIKALRPMWEWQSTLDYNKQPPRGYLSEGVDLLRGLDEMAEMLTANATPWANQFEFLTDLQTLQSRVRDAHFGTFPVLLNLVTFRSGVQFVSISEDSLKTPKIFLHRDVDHETGGYKPSPVSTIDGAPALEYLQRLAVRDTSSYDPDTRFNNLFPSVSKQASLFRADSQTLPRDGPRDTTTVVCENGTKFTFDNEAFVRANLTNITSAADLYRDFVVTEGKGPTPTDWLAYKLVEWGFAGNFSSGFPQPVKTTFGGDAAGFLPPHADFDDTAVLAINSFQMSMDIKNPSINPFEEPARVVADFIRTAKDSGRTKLILDMQGNGGGLITKLASVYFTLFPSDDILPQQHQLRVHPQLPSLLRDKPSTSPKDETLPWFLDMYEHVNGTAIVPPSSLIGPVTTPYGNTTLPLLWNASYYDLPSGANFTIPWDTPPFAPENITILTDGDCGSACFMFVSMLVSAHKIRTVAVGGRPINKPMQAIGGTRGGPLADFGSFPKYNASDVPPGLDVVPNTPGPLRLSITDTPGASWRQGVKFNFANVVPLGDKEDAVPMQFRYVAANCKIFYTWEMARDITALWRKVVDVAWKGGRCVEGSTTEEGGKMGGLPEYEVGVEDEYKLGDGPGAL
ncbi:hypothetical protein QBC34DRAFT_444409 [Podospora aff. communis PSN243]|uniref:Tail specific protease domain-containing protein n=1 Tax=Podospora aff. communis PSN243 TaxID=3040156 RepID=A0AAV9G4L6_9PEZI|nr:hypothetical protein QBC34DRAFT_444409 [Podospora aff. communis PSN243]